MKSFTIALLVAIASSKSLLQLSNNFAGGLSGDEDMTQDIA